MNEEVYRHVVLMLLSYIAAFALVLAVSLLSLEAVLGTVALGTALTFAVLAAVG